MREFAIAIVLVLCCAYALDQFMEHQALLTCSLWETHNLQWDTRLYECREALWKRIEQSVK